MSRTNELCHIHTGGRVVCSCMQHESVMSHVCGSCRTHMSHVTSKRARVVCPCPFNMPDVGQDSVCGHTGLFCGCTGPLCEDIALFCGKVGLLRKYRAFVLIRWEYRVLCVKIQVSFNYRNTGLFCGDMYLFYQHMRSVRVMRHSSANTEY